MGNGDMRATKEVVRQKIIAARDLIKCHPLTPQLATELFTSKGRFSAALIKWSVNELNDVKRLCVQAYKNAWHLPRSTASALFIFPKTHAGKERTLSMAVKQVLSLSSRKHMQVRNAHCPWQLLQGVVAAERCMRHEDVSKKIMLAGLNRTLDEWLCDSFVELIQEMELWKWDDATGDFWSRLAKAQKHCNRATSQSRGQSNWTAD